MAGSSGTGRRWLLLGAAVLVVAAAAGVWWVAAGEENRSGLPVGKTVTRPLQVWTDAEGAYLCPEPGLILTSSPPQCGAARTEPDTLVRVTGKDPTPFLDRGFDRGRYGVVLATARATPRRNEVRLLEVRPLPAGRAPGLRFRGDLVVWDVDGDVYGCTLPTDRRGSPLPKGSSRCGVPRSRAITLRGADLSRFLRATESAADPHGLVHVEGRVLPDGSGVRVTHAQAPEPSQP